MEKQILKASIHGNIFRENKSNFMIRLKLFSGL